MKERGRVKTYLRNPETINHFWGCEVSREGKWILSLTFRDESTFHSNNTHKMAVKGPGGLFGVFNGGGRWEGCAVGEAFEER